MNTEPAITVLMAVHNGIPYLRESVESILAQTFTDFEFLVVNDASTDESASILKEYQERDGRICLIENESNLGLAASLNRGLRAARGRYIARHDADDVSLPGRLSFQRDYLEKRLDIFLLGGGFIAIDEKGSELAVYRPSGEEEALRTGLPSRNLIAHPSIMFRNDRRHEYREKFLTGAEDYDFYLRLLSEGKRLANHPEAQIRYRWHRTPAVSAKHARYVLFGEWARRFHQERERLGRDSYEQFDPYSIMNLDIHQTTDAVVLRTFISQALTQNEFVAARQVMRRYFRAYGIANKYVLTYAATLMGKPGWGFLRWIKRRLRPDRSLSLTGAKGKRQERLGVVFATGDGVGTFVKIGSLSREMALFKKIAEAGWGVDFYTYDRTRTPPDPGFAVKVWPQFPYVFPRGLNKIYLLLFPLLRWGAGRRSSVVMTYQAHSGWPAILAARLWGAPVVARCGWALGEYAETTGLKGWRTWLQIRQERWTFRHADVCVLPTRELADWIIKKYNISGEKVRIVPNYVDTSLFQPDANTSPSIDILCVGRLTEVKRYPLLLEALKGMKVRVVIVGQGPLREALAEQARGYGLDLTIVERVPNERLPQYFNDAKIYYIGSTREGHSKSLIEAMACGRPCLGTRCPGIATQIIDGETGLIADSSPESIHETVQRLLSDEVLRRRLGENARQYAFGHWSLDKVCADYLAIFRSLSKGG